MSNHQSPKDKRLLEELDTVKDLLADQNTSSAKKPEVPVLRNPINKKKPSPSVKQTSSNTADTRAQLEQIMEQLIERKMRPFKELLRHELRKEIDKFLEEKK
jgi:hypothetical protein